MTTEIAKKGAPTLSEALKQWLSAELSSRWTTQNQQLLAMKNPAELAQVFDAADQAETAGRVIKGYVLEEFAVIGEESLESFIRDKGISHSTAYFWRDAFRIFNDVGDLALVERAAALGFTRMQELRPELRADGLRALIADGRAGDLTYNQACAMSRPELRAWRERVRHARLARRNAADRKAHPRRGPAPAYTEEPRDLTVAREEIAAITCRVRAELALLQQRFSALVAFDAQGDAPTELLCEQIGAGMLFGLRAIIHDADALDAATVRHFGGDTADLAGVDEQFAALESMRGTWIAEVNEAAKARASERHQRHGWQGRPKHRIVPPAPKIMAAAVRRSMGRRHE